MQREIEIDACQSRSNKSSWNEHRSMQREIEIDACQSRSNKSSRNEQRSMQREIEIDARPEPKQQIKSERASIDAA